VVVRDARVGDGDARRVVGVAVLASTDGPRGREGESALPERLVGGRDDDDAGRPDVLHRGDLAGLKIFRPHDPAEERA